MHAGAWVAESTRMEIMRMEMIPRFRVLDQEALHCLARRFCRGENRAQPNRLVLSSTVVMCISAC